MSSIDAPAPSAGRLPEGTEVKQNIVRRQRVGKVWRGIFFLSILFSLVALLTLVLDIANDSFGLIATESALDEQELTGGRELSELSQPELVAILEENLSRRVRDRLNREQPIAERSQENLVGTGGAGLFYCFAAK